MRCGARLLCILLLGACTTTPQTDPTTIDEGWMRNAEGEPPNILMISIDTMRQDHTGWTGRWSDSFTPHLDKFAREATRFKAASTTATATRPAVASLLTGVYPKTHGVEANPHTLSRSHATLAQILTQSGYSSAAFIANGLLSEEGGFHRGFENAATTSSYLGSLDKEIAKDGIQWLRQRDQNRPFFLWLHFMDPHGPYFSAPPPIRQEVPAKDGLTDLKLPVGKSNFGENIIPKYQALRNRPGTAQYRQRYRAEVRWTDRMIGRVLGELERLGLENNTLVLITADHGEHLGEKEIHFQHGLHVYEPTANVPLAFRLKGKIPAAAVRDTNVSLVDILPTIRAGLGLEANDAVDGRDLSRELNNLAAPSVPVFIQSAKNHRLIAARQDHFKLIYFPGLRSDQKAFSPTKTEKWMLFDLEEDPQESVNVSAAFPAVFNRLRAAILDYLQKEAPDSPEKTQDATISPELAERLRRLGYLD